MVARTKACVNDCQWGLLIENMSRVLTLIGMQRVKTTYNFILFNPILIILREIRVTS